MRRIWFQRDAEKKEQLLPVEDRIASLCAPLFDLCSFALKHKRHRGFPWRPFLRELNVEATAAEELLDNCGARKNEKWFPFREAIAAGKIFSAVSYDLLHIQAATPRYKLLDIEDDFSASTKKALRTLKETIYAVTESILRQANHCRICDEDELVTHVSFAEEVVPFYLPADKKVRHVRKTGETVVYLSTAFLNLSQDRDVKLVLKRRTTAEFEECIPDVVNEEKIRIVEARFHNLQSHYDTHIFESDIERQDRNLTILRGHISAIFHLMQMSTHLAHYYERHMSKLRRKILGDFKFPITPGKLLDLLFTYSLFYARQYMESATDLCRTMIHGFSEEREVLVPIPNYRGFHVRPSTLISRIVGHYGSSVTMILNGTEYNAGVTLELFRANEEINAYKRRYIGDILKKKINPQEMVSSYRNGFIKELQLLFLNLMNENEIILYDSALSFDDLELLDNETFADLSARYIKYYLSLGKIDIQSDLKVLFRGDNRALIDLKILAENGYGEDKYGNNIVLPPELAYLRR